MKTVLLALGTLLLLGGGGAGAYFYFTQSAEASSGAAGEIVKAERARKNDAPTSFVQLDPLILPVIDKHGVSQVVSLVIVIETTDEKNKTHVTNMSPRLKDAFIQDMYGALTAESVMRDGVLQVVALKNRLHKVSDRVMGAGVVNNVLLQVVQQRPV